MRVIQRVYLAVSSATLEPAAITARLELEPDEVALLGSRLSRSGARLPVNHLWQLGSRAPASARLDDHIRALLDRVAGRAVAIRALAGTGEATVYVSAVRTFVREPEASEHEQAREDLAGMVSTSSLRRSPSSPNWG